jgi:hypothetical protein
MRLDRAMPGQAQLKVYCILERSCVMSINEASLHEGNYGSTPNHKRGTDDLDKVNRFDG